MRALVVFVFVAVACLAFAAAAPAGSASTEGVGVRLDLTDPQGGPFPADRFTVPDATQLTGLRVDLPKPDCSVRPSDCDDIDVLNTLDGFNLQPRLSIPFTGAIDPATVTSDTVFLFKLSCVIAACRGDSRVGINQVVWDPAANTLYAESDQLLDQDARYVLVVTNGVRDPTGERIDSGQFHDVLHAGQTNDPAETAYRQALLAALDQLTNSTGMPPGTVAAASLFTTESATAVLEKIRDQLAQATPKPAGFLLGSNGERTVFPLSDVAGISWRRQLTIGDQSTTPPKPPSFTTIPVPLGSLQVVPGAIGTVGFGKYGAPNYENLDGVIPPVGTSTGVPTVQDTNDIYFNLFLPSGPEPARGWPVVIAAHGAGGGGKNTANAPWSVAATLAQHGLATIAINAVGYGGGPLDTLTVTNTDGTAVTLPGGGRGVDRNHNGRFDQPMGSLPEGLYTRIDCTAASDCPNAIVLTRDGFRQTAVDLMQLVREIQVGVDVNGDSVPDLDPNRVYYLGSSLGATYGTLFAALQPNLRAKVLAGDGGQIFEIGRLNSIGPFRAIPGQMLADRTPSLTNLAVGCGTDPVNPGNCAFPFDENIPPRNRAPIVNTVPGAIAIQNEIARIEWAMESGDPTAYAPHLRKAPLTDVPATPVLITFAQGDQIVPNSTTGTLLRAGDLADRTLYFRALDAYASIGISNPDVAAVHEWLVTLATTLPQKAKTWTLAGQESVATFLASDGNTTIDPDGAGPLFETPIAGPLP